MQIFHKLEDIPASFGPTLLSVGNFDGVHRAHTRVLANIVSFFLVRMLAKNLKGEYES